MPLPIPPLHRLADAVLYHLNPMHLDGEALTVRQLVEAINDPAHRRLPPEEREHPVVHATGTAVQRALDLLLRRGLACQTADPDEPRFLAVWPKRQPPDSPLSTAWHDQPRRLPVHIRRCRYCGELFHVKHGRHRYCPDRNCRVQDYVRRRQLRTERAREREADTAILENRDPARCCDVCGSPLEDAERSTRRYCDNGGRCRQRAYRRRQRTT